jgi:hypothetical protein
MSTDERSWSDLELEVAETMRKWRQARNHEIKVNWQVNAVNRRRALRPALTERDRHVTLTFQWHPADRYIWKTITLTATTDPSAAENLTRLWRAVEMLRMAESRDVDTLMTMAIRQMHPEPRSTGGTTAGSNTYTPPPPPRSRTPAEERRAPWYETLHVTFDAPLPVCEAAYRALMLRAHPDANGKNDLAVALNLAIEGIREHHEVKKNRGEHSEK